MSTHQKVPTKNSPVISAESQKHLRKILTRPLPYTVSIYGTDIKIDSHHVYPPGKLSEMFAKFLVEEVGVKNKSIIDIGSGCSALGLVLGKNGASRIVSIDVNEYAVACGKANARNHGLEDVLKVVQCDVAKEPLNHYAGEFDLVISGPLWETISLERFQEIYDDEKDLHRSFFDLGDGLIQFLLNDGFDLLKNREAGIYITSSLRIMPRIEALIIKVKVPIKIDVMAAEDIHNDGNIHYVLRLTQK